MTIRSKLFATVAMPLLTMTIGLQPALADAQMKPFQVAQADPEEELPRKRRPAEGQQEAAPQGQEEPSESGEGRPSREERRKQREAEQPAEEQQQRQAEPSGEDSPRPSREERRKQREAEQQQNGEQPQAQREAGDLDDRAGLAGERGDTGRDGDVDRADHGHPGFSVVPQCSAEDDGQADDRGH